MTSVGDFTRATCNHCGRVIKRGVENAPRAKCYNRGMQAHIETQHKDLVVDIREAQAELKPGERRRDPKDETVRGTVPIFDLRTHGDRRSFLKLVVLKQMGEFS